MAVLLFHSEIVVSFAKAGPVIFTSAVLLFHSEAVVTFTKAVPVIVI